MQAESLEPGRNVYNNRKRVNIELRYDLKLIFTFHSASRDVKGGRAMVVVTVDRVGATTAAG